MLEALDLRDVGVAVDDGLAVREPRGQPGLAAEPRSGVVNHPDLDVPDLDHPLPRQRPLQLLLVHVPANAFDGRPERAQLSEEVHSDEVAAVEDEIRGGDQADAFIGQRPCPPRQMRVGDDRDARQEAATGSGATLRGACRN